MRTIILLLVIIFLTNMIDFNQSQTYLNDKGYHLELNPNITNNEQLIQTFIIKYFLFWISFITLIILENKIPKKLLTPIKYVLFLIIGFNLAIITRNHLIMN